MVKTRGFRAWYCAIWAAMLALLGGAGYMEYFVQRHGDRAVFSYSIMSVCLFTIVVLAVFTYIRARITEE